MSQYKCPVCGSISKPLQVNSISSVQAAEYFAKEADQLRISELEKIIYKLWGGDRCYIVKCSGCTSRFSQPHVAGDADFYNMISANPTYPNSRWEFDLTKKIIVDLLRDGGNLLEIGSGSGNFIQQLFGLGLDPKKVVATEYSINAIKNLQKLGIRAEAVDFRKGVLGAPFRVIALFQTLEHLDNLDEVLSSLNNLTAINSHVFISVPNVDYLEWAELTLGVIDMPPNHVTGFSRDGLVKFLSKSGWEVQSLQMHSRNSMISRSKFGAMCGLQYPRNRIQKLLHNFIGLESNQIGGFRLYLSSVIVLFSDWRLFQKVPAENILIHIKRVS